MIEFDTLQVSMTSSDLQTEDGLYSVRFENDERTHQMVVKIVDRENDEVIRQVPAEELLALKAALGDLRGNIVDTEG